MPDFIGENPTTATFQPTADRLRDQRLQDEQQRREAGIDEALRTGIGSVYASPAAGSQPAATGTPAPTAPAQPAAPARGSGGVPSMQPVISNLTQVEGGGAEALRLFGNQRQEQITADATATRNSREDRRREDDLERIAVTALATGDMVTWGHYGPLTGLDRAINPAVLQDSRARGLLAKGMLIAEDLYGESAQAGRFSMGYMRSGGNLETAWNQAGGPPVDKPQLRFEDVQIEGQRRIAVIDELSGTTQGYVQEPGGGAFLEPTTASARATQLPPPDVQLLRWAETLISEMQVPGSVTGQKQYERGTPEYDRAILETVQRWKTDPSVLLAQLDGRVDPNELTGAAQAIAGGAETGGAALPTAAPPPSPEPTATGTTAPASTQPAPAQPPAQPSQPGNPLVPSAAPSAELSQPIPAQPPQPAAAPQFSAAVPEFGPDMLPARTPTPMPTPIPDRGPTAVRPPTGGLRSADQGPPTVEPMPAPPQVTPTPGAAPATPNFITGGQATMDPQPPPGEPTARFIGYSAGDSLPDGTPIPTGLPVFERADRSQFIYDPR